MERRSYWKKREEKLSNVGSAVDLITSDKSKSFERARRKATGLSPHQDTVAGLPGDGGTSTVTAFRTGMKGGEAKFREHTHKRFLKAS